MAHATHHLHACPPLALCTNNGYGYGGRRISHYADSMRSQQRLIRSPLGQTGRLSLHPSPTSPSMTNLDEARSAWQNPGNASRFSSFLAGINIPLEEDPVSRSDLDIRQ